MLGPQHSCKPRQERVPGEVKGPKGEGTGIILVNGHDIKLPCMPVFTGWCCSIPSSYCSGQQLRQRLLTDQSAMNK